MASHQSCKKYASFESNLHANSSKLIADDVQFALWSSFYNKFRSLTNRNIFKYLNC